MKRMFFCLIAVLFFSSGVFAQNAGSNQEPELLSESINKISPVKAGQTVVIPGFYFEPGSSAMNKSLREHIRNISKEILKIKYRSVTVKSYTDNSGSPQSNKALSRQRAKAVSGELIKNGIPAKAVTYYGMGAADPIADNNTKNGRTQNRRTEITVK